MKKYVEWIAVGTLSGLALLIAGIAIGSVFQNLIFEQYVELLRILIWPAIILLALLFFRKVFTYMFFSMESFNFFGAKGQLKNVQVIIREKADELVQQEKRETEFVARLDALAKEKQGSEEAKRFARQLLNDYSELSKENQAKLRENETLRAQVSALLNQVAALQGQYRGGGSVMSRG